MMQDIKNSNKINIDEIIQQYITLYFAGTDTTAFNLLIHYIYLRKYL